MMRFADKTSTGIDIGALEKLARETERTMNLILGPLFGLFLSRSNHLLAVVAL